MKKFLSIFKNKIKFFYSSWDRMVINGYLTTLLRPEQLVYFFHTIAGKKCITKDVLKERTEMYNAWVKSYATNHKIPIFPAQKGNRKEDFVLPYYRAFKPKEGVVCILKSMEQNRTFCSYLPQYPTKDPDYRIIKSSRSRFLHYYFYLLDPVMGPMSLRVASYIPFNMTFYLNGHSYLAMQMDLKGIKYRKEDNVFTSLQDPSVIETLNQNLTPHLLQSRLDYWALRLGPSFSKQERQQTPIRYEYSLSQMEYATDIAFKRTSHLKNMFDRACELGLLISSADRISKLFGMRITRRIKGKLQSVLDKRDVACPVIRYYFKNTFLRNYFKNLNLSRTECCTNNTYDLGVKRRIQNLPLLKEKMQKSVENFLDFQTEVFNNTSDTGALAELAKPILIGKRRIPGLKLQDNRLLRLLDVLLHDGSSLTEWTTAQLYTLVLKKYHLTPENYTISQLRYDLSKLRAHGLVEKIQGHRRYQLTSKGVKLGVLFVQFHTLFAGPLTSMALGNTPVSGEHTPDSKIEKQHRKIKQELDRLASLLKAA
jgi:hypothetical protein